MDRLDSEPARCVRTGPVDGYGESLAPRGAVLSGSNLSAARITAAILFLAPVLYATFAVDDGSASVVQVANFEDAEHGTERLISQESSADRITVVDEVEDLGTAIEGRSSAEMRCGRQDQGVAGSGTAWRTELRVPSELTRARPGSTQRWEFQFLLGADLDAPPTPEDWMVLLQFHPAIDRSSPQLALELSPDDELLLRVRGGDPDRPHVATTTLLPLVERSRVYAVQLDIRWSTADDGEVTARVDGEEVGRLIASNSLAGADPYLKFGCYRSAAEVGEGTLWIDGVRVTQPPDADRRQVAVVVAVSWSAAAALIVVTSLRRRFGRRRATPAQPK